MTDARAVLQSVPVFAGLSDEALSVVAELLSPVEWAAGEELPLDTDRALYVVTAGEVEIFSVVGGIEKLFMTVQPGGLLGLLSMLHPDRPTGHARASLDTTALALSRDDLDGLLESNPQAAARILDGIGSVLGERVRVLGEMYEAALAWNLEVTGLASLNLERLLTDRVHVEVETSSGGTLSGLLLRFEASAAGHEIYLETSDRQVQIVPYHAIVRVSVDADAVRTEDSN